MAISTQSSQQQRKTSKPLSDCRHRRLCRISGIRMKGQTPSHNVARSVKLSFLSPGRARGASSGFRTVFAASLPQHSVMGHWSRCLPSSALSATQLPTPSPTWPVGQASVGFHYKFVDIGASCSPDPFQVVSITIETAGQLLSLPVLQTWKPRLTKRLGKTCLESTRREVARLCSRCSSFWHKLLSANHSTVPPHLCQYTHGPAVCRTVPPLTAERQAHTHLFPAPSSLCFKMIPGLPVPSCFHWSRVGEEGDREHISFRFCLTHVCIFPFFWFWLFSIVAVPSNWTVVSPVDPCIFLQAGCLHACGELQTPGSGCPSKCVCGRRNALP